MKEIEKFKKLLEYFVAHLEYVNKSTNPKGENEYIIPILDKGFRKEGCGYNGDNIQRQIKGWDEYNVGNVGITIKSNYGNYKTKKCYLNWVGTGINIFAGWKGDKIDNLYIGYCYWWYSDYSEAFITRTISELELFKDNISSNLQDFCNYFMDEKKNYNNKKGEYYKREKEYYDSEKKEKVMKRNELYISLLRSNNNIVLTGAPGTGKTYLAKQIAQQMIFDEVKEKMTEDEQKQFNEQCGFVQFHPSYDYTDFVEGLRPKQDEDDDGNIGFERKNGVFKDFCARAIAKKANEENKFDEIWGKFITEIRNNLSNGTLTRIGSWEYGLSTKDSLKYSSINTPSQYSFTITKKNIWDTYCGRQARPSGAFQKDMLDIVQYLKQKYNLSDNPELTETDDKTTKNYVFIIDEINRGEISKVFGELFFSIDPGYRGAKGKVQTQYQNLIEDGDVFKDGFYVPQNVYIIGTMNDIDRSVESMDFAFRRRFAFNEIKAVDRKEMLYDTENGLGKDAEKAENRMIHLNEEIEKIEGLSSAYHVGPAYFLKLKNYDGNFSELWKYHLEGLLREYLRGMQDVEGKINVLKEAYENENDPNDGQQQ